jgi:divalent metal cation (Fe/Co/Zn/Cd) transporter
MKKLEIKNAGGFFIGLIILMVGIFIIIFDYPQIQYLQNLESEPYYLLEEETKNIYERLKIEFAIGITILAIGIVLCMFSLIKAPKRNRR